MPTLLDDPMVQAGMAPFVVAFVVAWLLSSLRLSGLAIVAGVATAIALSTGIGFTPLSASRKIVLLVLLAPVIGLVLDRVVPPRPIVAPVVSLAAGLAAVWVFQTVLGQQEAAVAATMGGGVAVFVAVLVHLVLGLRDDGIAGGAATVGLGLAVGVAAILSASIGNMMNGVALAVSGAALLLVQLLRGSAFAPGFAGMLTTAVAAALFAAATFVLAELRWPALVALGLVPLAARLPLHRDRGERVRIVLLGLVCVLAALATIGAAWLATRTATH